MSSRLHGFVARAAFGIQELKQLLKRVGVRGVAEERAFASHVDEIFGFELVEMMGQRGVRNIELLLNFADDQAFGMGGKRSCMMRSRGSVPMAENMSAYLATCAADFFAWPVFMFPVFMFR